MHNKLKSKQKDINDLNIDKTKFDEDIIKIGEEIKKLNKDKEKLNKDIEKLESQKKAKMRTIEMFKTRDLPNIQIY